MIRHARRLLLVLVVLVAGCRDGTEPTDPGGPGGGGPAAMLEISPAALLLTEPGGTARLTALAFDAAGVPTEADVTWHSSDPAAISVGADGTVTAGVAVGSVRIVAETTDGVRSAPVTAIVAPLVDGAVVVGDEQVAGDPVSVDPADEFGVGWRYRVILDLPAAPSPGTVIVGTGEAVVAGRVVDVAPSGSAWAVTLEMVPLNELFQDLRIELELALPQEPPVAGGSGGVGAGSLAPGRADGRAARGLVLPGDAGSGEIEFPVGPFKCKVGGNVPLPTLAVQNVSQSVTHDLTMRLDYDLLTGLELLTVHGSVQGQWSARPVLVNGWKGGAKCEIELAQPTLPTFGWLSMYFGFKVPLGIGFELKAVLELGQVGMDLAVEAGATIGIEASCPIDAVDCSWIFDIDPEWTGTVRPVVPDLDDARVELRGSAYAFAKLNLGPGPALTSVFPVLNEFKYKLLEARFGVTEQVDLAGMVRQAGDPAYASAFDFKLDAELKADLELKTGMEWLGRKLGVVIQIVEFPLWVRDWPLAHSPAGSFAIEPSSVMAGDSTTLGDRATFTVELDPVTYLGMDAVEGVEIQWQKDDGAGGFTLANGRPGCTYMSASPGQTSFSCEMDFLEEHVGEQVFHAFVHTKRYGVPIPVPLAVAPDASAHLTVLEAGQIVVEPAAFPDTITGGQSATLRARVGRVTGGTTEYGPGYTVSFGTSGGTAEPASAPTDADGWAEAVITANPNHSMLHVSILAIDAHGNTGSASMSAVIREPPGEVELVSFLMVACAVGGSPMLTSVDDIPASLSNSWDSGFHHCRADTELTVTTLEDGTVIIAASGSVTASSGAGIGRASLEFRLTKAFDYAFEAEVAGSGLSYAWLWDGPQAIPGLPAHMVACAGLVIESAMTNPPCPLEADATGVMAARLYTIILYQGHPTWPTDASGNFVLTLTPR